MDGVDAIPGQDLAVRRAEAGDAKRVADFVNRWGTGRELEDRVEVGPRAVMRRLDETEFLLAEEGDTLLGLIGWRAENLVACVTDLLIWPADQRRRVGRALFDAMEAAATDQQAELALLVLPPSRLPEVVGFCQDVGYARRSTVELPRAWREMAHRAGCEDEEEMLIKGLRSNSVASPFGGGFMSFVRRFFTEHPQLAAWFVLAVGMVAILVWTARDVGLLPGQWAALVVATIGLAGLCIWIIGWEDEEEEGGQAGGQGRPGNRQRPNEERSG
ncbi:MAG: GNAT family N-acetyltransferase [Anaerolineae bacterium]|nr:GNAT family N-acetyltransferase [Anaerolineae bacterium]